MQIRRLVVSSLFVLAACGGGKKPAPVEPAPAAPDPTADTAPATPPPAPAERAEAVAQPAPPPPPAPKLALGDAKIMMSSKKKPETIEIVLAADGTITATMVSGKKKDKTTKTAKLGTDGQLTDDKGEVVAKIGDGGTVAARQVFEEKQDGKVTKSDTKWEDVGTLADDGSFTAKKDGKKISLDDKGKLVGMPTDVTFVVTAGPEQKKAAMFLIVAMLTASKMSTDSSGAKAEAVPAPAPKK